MTDKLYISWNEFHRDVKNLAEKIKKQGQFKRIIAVSRGGLIPAGILSYELDIRQCDSINIQTYDAMQQRSAQDIIVNNKLDKADAQTLIVDDLSDSGQTFQILQKLFPNAYRVAVYAKPNGKKDTNIFARALPDQWVVFPWDIE